MPYVYDDGGRLEAGYTGQAGDCVARSVAIASGYSYAEVYRKLASGMGAQRKSKGKTARNGISTGRKWFKEYMRSMGFVWVPTMRVGGGCTVHLLKNELPPGRLVVAVSKHYTCVIDGVIRDSHNPTRASIITEAGQKRMAHRCVYGFWVLTPDGFFNGEKK